MSELRFYVYGYSVNGVMLYIGKGTGYRYKEHLRTCYELDTLWARALRKFLGRNITPDHFIIQNNLSSDAAYDLEKKLIVKYGLKCKGTGTLYNLTEGGIGPNGRKATPTEIEAMRIRTRGNTYALGMVHSAEAKERQGAFHRGVQKSEETRRKMSAAFADKIPAQVEKAKAYIAHTWWGKHASIEYSGQVRRQSPTATHRLYNVTLDGITVQRTITDFRQGSCPVEFAPLREKFI